MKIRAVKKIKLRKKMASDGKWQCLMMVLWGWGVGENQHL